MNPAASRLTIHGSRLALALFVLYVCLFPGSTITSALDAVPAWGTWMGAALLLGQGLAALAWLAGSYGRRGLAAAAAGVLVAWLVEHSGETTGFPFGAYAYTDSLQPQVLDVVPLPIMCAWLMVALGAWQIARMTFTRHDRRVGLLAATLVVVIDLQIETVATRINPYWEWATHGTYYGVPLSNFIAWWFVGLMIAILFERIIGRQAPQRPAMQGGRAAWVARQIFPIIPALLFIMSSLMFTLINLARGYTMAGMVGIIFLMIVAVVAARNRWQIFPEFGRAAHPTTD